MFCPSYVSLLGAFAHQPRRVLPSIRVWSGNMEKRDGHRTDFCKHFIPGMFHKIWNILILVKTGQKYDISR